MKPTRDDTPRTYHLDNSIVRADATSYVVMRDHAADLEMALTIEISRNRQLAEQRAELVAALDKLQEAVRNRRYDADEMDDAASEARAILAKCAA